MKHSLLAPVLLSLTCLSFTAVPQKSAPAAQVDDPFLWLEEIEAPRAVAWARAENDKTLGVLQSDPHNGRFYEEALSMLHAKDRIPYVSLERRGLSNFCRDENHVRGIWQRTRLDSHSCLTTAARCEPWRIRCFSPPEERLCLVPLCDGRKDAARPRVRPGH
ncbi:hypothetical protein ACVWZZ_005685 [Bradyrhizobium sp. LM6.10]